MRRLGRTVAALVAVMLTAPPALADGIVYKTPQEAFDTLVAALKHDDWKTACTTLTDETIDQMTGALLVRGISLKRFMEEFAAKDRQGKLKEPLKILDALFERHGLTKEKLEKLDLKSVLKGKGDKKDLQKGFAMLAASVKDRCGFLGDFFKALKKLPGKQDAPGFVPVGDVALKDLKVEGNSASGSIVAMKDGKEKRDPIRFRKIGEGWKIELELKTGGPRAGAAPPPPLRRKVRACNSGPHWSVAWRKRGEVVCLVALSRLRPEPSQGDD